MSLESNAEMISVPNVIRSFRYWPRVFQMLWKVSPVHRTVSYYITNLFNKMHAKRRIEVALKGVIKGYIKNDIIESLLH